MLEGSTSFRHGPHLEHVDTGQAGDLVHVPAGVPHQPFNPTDRPARALVARTDPNEQESVVLLRGAVFHVEQARPEVAPFRPPLRRRHPSGL